MSMIFSYDIMWKRTTKENYTLYWSKAHADFHNPVTITVTNLTAYTQYEFKTRLVAGSVKQSISNTASLIIRTNCSGNPIYL